MSDVKSENSWSQVTHFIDRGGRKVTQYEVLSGDEKGRIFYTGTITLAIKTGNPVQPILNRPFEFDFPDDQNRQWCFDNFDTVAAAKVKEFEEEKKRQMAEKAKEIKIPPMVDARGKPLTKV